MFALKLKGLFGELPPYSGETLGKLQEEIAGLLVPNEEGILRNCLLLDEEGTGFLARKDFATVMITVVKPSDE